MRPRRIAPVGPRLRQRDLPADRPGAHEYPAGAAALDEQNLQTPPVQRMERMGDNGETQIVTARSVTMPPPWAPRASSCLCRAASVSPPRAPEAETRFPRT